MGKMINMCCAIDCTIRSYKLPQTKERKGNSEGRLCNVNQPGTGASETCQATYLCFVFYNLISNRFGDLFSFGIFNE